VHSVFGKINYGGLNTTAYTWDWYCHLVGDRASLLKKKVAQSIATFKATYSTK